MSTTWYNLEHVPKKARRSVMIRKLAQDIISGRATSTHSASAHTLPLVIDALEKAGVGYKIIAAPGVGYYVERAPSCYLPREAT